MPAGMRVEVKGYHIANTHKVTVTGMDQDAKNGLFNLLNQVGIEIPEDQVTYDIGKETLILTGLSKKTSAEVFSKLHDMGCLNSETLRVQFLQEMRDAGQSGRID